MMNVDKVLWSCLILSRQSRPPRPRPRVHTHVRHTDVCSFWLTSLDTRQIMTVRRCLPRFAAPFLCILHLTYSRDEARRLVDWPRRLDEFYTSFFACKRYICGDNSLRL